MKWWVDQGSEFDPTFARITGSHAGWQQGLVERLGGLLGDIWNKAVCEFHIKGRHQDKLADHVHAGQERNSDEVLCHTGTEGVRMSIEMVCTFNE